MSHDVKPFSFVKEDLEIRDKNGCDTSFQFQISAATSIIKSSAEKFKLYPNPSNEYLYLDYGNQKAFFISWTIFNQFGQNILHGLYNETQNRLDITQLKPGIYWLRFQFDGQLFTQEFIKH